MLPGVAEDAAAVAVVVLEALMGLPVVLANLLHSGLGLLAAGLGLVQAMYIL